MDFEKCAQDYHQDFHATFAYNKREDRMEFEDFAQKWKGYIKQHFPIISDTELSNAQVCYGVAYVIMLRNKKLYQL